MSFSKTTIKKSKSLTCFFLALTLEELIKNKAKTPDDLAEIKRKVAKKHKTSQPDNISLLKTYHELLKKKKIKKSPSLEFLLRKRPVRSLSGIVNISVLTRPYPCPGKCIFCPQESGLPKSYLSGEPAVERAKKMKFHPFWQVKKRIESLKLEGHPTDKIELRIVGGTWSYYPKQYQSWFVKKCFDACNDKDFSDNKDFSSNKNDENKEKSRQLKKPWQIKSSSLSSLEELFKSQKKNEKAKHRIVGLSVETRPDFIDKKEIKRLRELGVTMVELGIQSIYEKVLKANLRGHGSKEIILATKLLKDAGFKVLYQIMPNLFGSDLKKDKKMFKEIFSNPDFQPDLLKIYPCALLKETFLYKLWKKGKYKPYSQKQLVSLVKSIKKAMPCYVRIQRISRDIPAGLIVTGPAKVSNLRQILKENMKKEKWHCNCIRCREIKENYFFSTKKKNEKIKLIRKDYKASEGKEVFLSFESFLPKNQRNKQENKNKAELLSLLRLRITSENKAIVREVHTFGQQLPIKGKKDFIWKTSPQDKGLGKKLIKEAEKITKEEFHLNEIKVIAAVGARKYFRKLDYRLKETYMVKSI